MSSPNLAEEARPNTEAEEEAGEEEEGEATTA